MGGMTSARILLAEDDDLTRELLAKVLRREGYEVVETTDGAEAIAELGRGGFDLVLSDVQMARASGMELLGEVARAI
jgi:CheY-like chemotaxis protein